MTVISKVNLLAMVCLAVLLFGCNKKNAIKNKGLYGTWRLSEVYDQYGSGEPNLWQSVPNEDTHFLEFMEDGQYKKSKDSSGQVRNVPELMNY